MNGAHPWIAASLCLLGWWNVGVFGQVECSAPGNLRGIRLDGELMAFSTSIRAVAPPAAEEGQAGRGRGGGQFSRDGGALIVNGSLTGGGGGRGYSPPPPRSSFPPPPPPARRAGGGGGSEDEEEGELK